MFARLLPFAAFVLSSTLAGRILPAAQGGGQVQPHAGMLRFPDVSRSHVVFSYANDLWLVPRGGGVAVPLASPPGPEIFPRFSPDGQTIAFQGNYEGNRDLYTIPAAGGIPARVTYHPASEILCDWTPDGKLLFFSGAQSFFPKWQRLFTVGPPGGLPQALPVPYGTNGAVSPDGNWLAYTPFTRDNATWKRYRGGMATDLWLFHFPTQRAERITDWEGTDTQPMWHGDVLYYLSDAGPEHRWNVWKWERRSRARAQLTFFEDFDLKWPAIGPGPDGQGEIVFQHGAKLRLLDLASLRSTVVEVSIPGERTYLRPKSADASQNIDSWEISPAGKRAVAQARGDVWTLPAKNGFPRNLSASSGAAERSPAWSPDGRWIAYFSDASGEYELMVTQSDGKGETRRLTHAGGPFKTDIVWSPDSKRLAWRDKTSALFLTTLESGETRKIDEDPWSFAGPGVASPSWSHDGRWLTWARSREDMPAPAVWLYNVEKAEKHQATSGVFGDVNPVFDRKGDWLFFTSARSFSPHYSDIDTSFVYDDSQVLLAVPLRADVKSPWLPEVDEETWDEDQSEEEKEEQAEEGQEEEEKEEAQDDAGAAGAAAGGDDGLSGTWEGTITGDDLPPGGVSVTAYFELEEDGTVSGHLVTPMGAASILEGSFDRASGRLKLKLETDAGDIVDCEGEVSGDSMSGTASIAALGVNFQIKMTRTEKKAAAQDAAAAPAAEKKQDEADKKDDKKKEKKPVEIDLDGLEGRAMLLPVKNGSFGRLAVNDKNQLLYVRNSGDGSSIQLFDLADKDKEEKTVAGGAGDFRLSANGKKLLVLRGGGAAIQDAAPGGKAENVPTGGMQVAVDPRQEWRQMFLDAWRIERDYFYDPNMHGVDWQRVRDQYLAMIDDCASRQDLTFVLGEMISELNVGHAYLGAPGDVESQPAVNVGLLGVDFELHDGAYRLAKIYRGAPWDADARGPLGAPGVEIAAGDYLLAVNGVPLDTARDPWAAFQGLAGRLTTLTVSDKPVRDDQAREVVVEPVTSEFGLRFRAWIEHNRAYVAEKTGGRIGYVYVTDTGVSGQNDLFRQFYGQINKGGMIIDERWNGGGQIPTRFIELLRRPATNYWAGRDGRDWHWPPDSHQGPKCMLINGLAGSGGDAFPAYFRQAGLGKLIGTRTWGGLVGISGNPSLIDGGSVTVPTFAYYELDGTWGIEGHGVEPDLEVVDDPGKMLHGEDPQLDAAIEHLLAELQRSPFAPVARPAYPDRSGMGLAERDK